MASKTLKNARRLFAEPRSEVKGVSANDIIEAARLYAAGPSCFVSGHGIDAFSNGVQTFRAFHCLVAIQETLTVGAET